MGWILERAEELFQINAAYLAVLIEPAIDGAFPDIIITEYHPAVYESWSDRTPLSRAAYRVAHYLYHHGASEFDAVGRALALTPREAVNAVAALNEAGWVTQRAELVILDRERAYGLGRVLAIEVKTSPSSRGLIQAARNGWFTSETYFAAAGVATSRLMTLSQQLGVGVIGYDSSGLFPLSAPLRDTSPRSWATWMVNDWVGRRSGKP